MRQRKYYLQCPGLCFLNMVHIIFYMTLDLLWTLPVTMILNKYLTVFTMVRLTRNCIGKLVAIELLVTSVKNQCTNEIHVCLTGLTSYHNCLYMDYMRDWHSVILQ